MPEASNRRPIRRRRNPRRVTWSSTSPIRSSPVTRSTRAGSTARTRPTSTTPPTADPTGGRLTSVVRVEVIRRVLAVVTGRRVHRIAYELLVHHVDDQIAGRRRL